MKRKLSWWARLSPERKKEIIEKRAQTKLKKYGDPTYNNPDKNKQTCLKKYGVSSSWQVDGVKKKIKESCKSRYGSDHHLQNETILTKQKTTNLKKYGVENVSQSPLIQERMKNNCLEKYGVESPNQLQEVKEKKKQSCLEKYGVENPQQNKEIKEKNKRSRLINMYRYLFASPKFNDLIEPLFKVEEYNGSKKEKYKFRCKKCGTEFEDGIENGRIPRCFKCYPVSNFTIPHKIICEYLDSQNIPYEVEKYINPYFGDIFIEPNKIIEIYGDYWHGNPEFYEKGADLSLPWGKIKVEEKWEKDKNRVEFLKRQNFRILILWEDDIIHDFMNIEKKLKKFVNEKLEKQ
jgi:G:T-mismatch repair DNA endonuclease (very short patch repair protein)